MNSVNDPIQDDLVYGCNRGLVLVDAGPGTGKTTTMVRRYVNLLDTEKREDGSPIEPSDILMLTFTRNAADEMQQRARSLLYSEGKKEVATQVEAMTFDSFCSHLVQESSDAVEEMFGIDIKALRTSTIVGDEDQNRSLFLRIATDHLDKKYDAERYGQYQRIGKKKPSGPLDVIKKLMSMGMIPKEDGSWFGIDPDKGFDMDGPMTDVKLMAYFHDIYLEYIRACLANGRMTYNLVSLIALMILYCDPSARARNSYDYVMIDEFQDTDMKQLLITLLILKHPNLCVIGDWKQGIYGFRNATIDNIIEFEKRIRAAAQFINEGSCPLEYDIPDDVKKIDFKNNYRSSKRIIDASFEALRLKAFPDEKIPKTLLNRIVQLNAIKEMDNDQSCIRIIDTPTDASEPEIVSKAVNEYISSDRFTNADNGKRLHYGNISVLCRTGKQCTEVFRTLSDRGIPSYIQGEIDVFTDTQEGSLINCWMNLLKKYWKIDSFEKIMPVTGCSAQDISTIRNLTNYKGYVQDMPQRMPKKLRDRYDRYIKLIQRPSMMAATIFRDYGLDTDYANSIIYAISDKYSDCTNTFWDIADRIDYEAFAKKGKYEVEPSIEEDAVRIMTMHKSKGLEFEAVIIPFLDAYLYKKNKLSRYRDPTVTDDSNDYVQPFFITNDRIVCTKKLSMSGLVDNDNVESLSLDSEYDEDRRLLFVAMSRAKQYLTITYRPDVDPKGVALGANAFRTGLECSIMDAERSLGNIGIVRKRPVERSNRPMMGSNRIRAIKITPHDLMVLDSRSPEKDGRLPSKGRDHGVRVHECAELMCNGDEAVHDDLTQLEKQNIMKVLNHLPGSVAMSEIQCRYRMPGTNIIVSGVIDLLLKKGNTIEIHDYKTDAYEPGTIPASHDEYRLQLSIYAYAAMDYYKTDDVTCFIDYISVEECSLKPIKLLSREEVHNTAKYYVKNHQLS